eukprot:1195649-Prorocentrum_minimum.AAC.3
MTPVEPARPSSVVATRRHGRGGPQAPAAQRGARTAPTRPQGQGILLLLLIKIQEDERFKTAHTRKRPKPATHRVQRNDQH